MLFVLCSKYIYSCEIGKPLYKGVYNVNYLLNKILNNKILKSLQRLRFRKLASTVLNGFN